MSKPRSAYLALIAVLLSPTAANADAIIFDGGAPDQINGNEDTAWVQVEDFVLGGDATLAGVTFWTAETGTWDGTLEWYLFADVAGNPDAAPFASGNGVDVQRSATGNVVSGFAPEFMYSFSLGSPVDLLGGVTYWLGLHQSADFISDGIYWETTSAGFGMTGHESFGGTFDNWSDNGLNHAFYLTTSVPEPGTLALLGIGLLGMAATRRRRRI